MIIIALIAAFDASWHIFIKCYCMGGGGGGGGGFFWGGGGG